MSFCAKSLAHATRKMRRDEERIRMASELAASPVLEVYFVLIITMTFG